VLHGPILADKSLDGTVFKVEDTAIITAAAGVLGAFVGGGAAIWAASVAADKAENAAVAKEERDRQRQSDDAVAAARRDAAAAAIEDLATMRDLWIAERGSPVDDARRARSVGQ
jgi:hypothetical protein